MYRHLQICKYQTRKADKQKWESLRRLLKEPAISKSHRCEALHTLLTDEVRMCSRICPYTHTHTQQQNTCTHAKNIDVKLCTPSSLMRLECILSCTHTPTQTHTRTFAELTDTHKRLSLSLSLSLPLSLSLSLPPSVSAPLYLC